MPTQHIMLSRHFYVISHRFDTIFLTPQPLHDLIKMLMRSKQDVQMCPQITINVLYPFLPQQMQHAVDTHHIVFRIV